MLRGEKWEGGRLERWVGIGFCREGYLGIMGSSWVV